MSAEGPLNNSDKNCVTLVIPLDVTMVLPLDVTLVLPVDVTNPLDFLSMLMTIVDSCSLSSSQEVQVNIDGILQVAQRLQEIEFYDVEVIDVLVQKLDNEWKKLYMAVERRSALLASSYSFHGSSDKVCCATCLPIYLQLTRIIIC